MVSAIIRETVARMLGLDPNAVNEATVPSNLEGWDSTLFLELVLALEERLGFQFDADDIARIHSVGDIEALARVRHAG